MATAELKDDATHEEITQVVDQIVEDRKGDAQQIAEERDEPVTETEETPVVETDSEDDRAKPNTGDSEDQADEWLDDDLKAEVAAMGIDEKELADFTSREELQRALRIADRSDLEAGRKARAERDDKGRFAPKEPESETEEGESKEGQYEIGLSDIWDDEAKADLVGQFTNLRDHYEARVAAVEARFAEADAMARQQQFDAAVDAMGHADLFGKTGKEGRKELERRQGLLDECEDIIAGREIRGRPVASYESLVGRVANMVFADELGKKELKARTRKLSTQANGRGGDSATKPPSPVESLREEMRRRHKELEDAG